MAMSEQKIRFLWRTKYPWLFFLYIFMIAVMRVLLSNKDPRFAMDMLMLGTFASYVFLHIFYLFGVRPTEIEDKSR